MIVFYNPHVDDFLAEPPHFRLLRRRPLKKYSYLIEGALAETGELRVFVDGTISAFIPDRYFSLFPRFLRRWISNYEVRQWVRINNLEGKIKLIHHASEAKGDTLFAFSYKAAVGAFDRRLPDLAGFAQKIFHLSHYFISTKEKAENLKKLDDVILAGDSDISNNSYFRRFFDWYDRPFLVLPFAVAPRFQIRQSFSERETLCVATGTFHNLHDEIPIEKYRDYINFFHLSTYHPVRKLIHDQQATLRNWIVSKISLYRGKTKGSLFSRLFKHFSVSQKAYFNIDIVDLYNRYCYAIVGEEAVGFPALGAFEAMACGCVLIAQREYYAGLGMVPNVHFVPHEGTLASIISAIESLNADPKRAARISEAAVAYVVGQCRPNIAYLRFLSKARLCVEQPNKVGSC
ncbi:MAG: glycosyltransferase [Candidatus Manganitrophus sp.]|nr:glycosyltransferase [Candidatus Manganitrophus sp.]MDC4226492.1 glycosyltransferase [Candidatus Manganitrophus sp.]WDT72317.1 MAG: glycosyltransferase [Candidatus Manganitrophus sp.]WDT75441.1 MAG: glycosyltransferase [Candidatus Manganitrophus sp.]WDT80246.1 MAG: glycosyltransferase [Candidatus Manganitrophus sp.]